MLRPNKLLISRCLQHRYGRVLLPGFHLFWSSLVLVFGDLSLMRNERTLSVKGMDRESAHSALAILVMVSHCSASDFAGRVMVSVVGHSGPVASPQNPQKVKIFGGRHVPREPIMSPTLSRRETSATALATPCHVAAPLATPARAATPRSARESPGFDPLLASSAPDAPGLFRNPQRDRHGSRGASRRRRIGPLHAFVLCGPAGALLRLCRRAVRIGQLRMSRANVDRTEPAWSWFKQPYHYES